MRKSGEQQKLNFYHAWHLLLISHDYILLANEGFFNYDQGQQFKCDFFSDIVVLNTRRERRIHHALIPGTSFSQAENR
jgi:hypothetical protein